MKKILVFVAIIFCSAICFSQSLSRNDFVDLAIKIDSFVSIKDSVYDAKCSSQFVYVLIRINSKGTIDKLDLSGIRSDTIYEILQSLKPSDLKEWQCLSCKGKTIVIPLFYISGNDLNDKVKQMFNTHYAKIPHKDMITEVGNTILVRYLSILAHEKPFEESLPNRVTKISDAKKEN